MPIIPSIYSKIKKRRLEEIDRMKTHPEEFQSKVIFHLLKYAENTEWGKKFNFNSIKSIEQFQNIVPINCYESLKADIQRNMNGEQNILWPTKINWFAKSSGTTSDKSKFIPISPESLDENHYQSGRDILAIYFYRHQGSKLFRGKSLIIGGSHSVSNVKYRSYSGDLSAVLLKNLTFWFHLFRTPNLSIALMDEWEQKIELMARETIRRNVTSIAGVPSWTLVLAKRILEITGKANLREVWPNLELFIHGGVSFHPYKDQFKALVPNGVMNYMETYNASEGFFAIQDNPETDSMLLMLDYGVFYEFILLEEVHLDNPQVFVLQDVELDKNYAMIITTNCGLWRYKIGDTVKFTSKYPFKIKITGRIKHFINAFGEELIIDNAEKALKEACEQTGAEIKEYTAGPVFMGEHNKGGHEWLIEFEKHPSNLQLFSEVLDSNLKMVNSDYEAKRYKDLSLVMPLVTSVKSGVFYEWLKLKGKLGGQHKIPRLANNREYIDEINSINKAF